METPTPASPAARFRGVGSASALTNNLRADRVTESQGATKFIRTGEAATRTPASASRKEMPELKGDGILFPALLIGLGQTGMHLLHRLREVLVERFESLSRLPHVRMRLLDTDPEITRQAATAGRGSVAFSSQEILVAGLNRPSYYLKPRDGKAGLDSWLNPRMLYRIPRSGQTTGVRALGRLAYCDNFRTIQRHLQADLEACLDPVALNTRRAPVAARSAHQPPARLHSLRPGGGHRRGHVSRPRLHHPLHPAQLRV